MGFVGEGGSGFDVGGGGWYCGVGLMSVVVGMAGFMGLFRP